MIQNNKTTSYKYGFIERGDATEKFGNLVTLQKQGTGNALYVYAAGGIGKTKLLLEYVCRYKNIKDYMQAQSTLIDFYDLENRTVLGLRRNIVNKVGGEYFADFLKKDNELRELEQTRMDAKLSGQMSALQFEMAPLFFDDLRKVPVELRANTIFVFDTFELVSNRAVGRWLLMQFIPEAIKLGYLVVFAGRPNEFALPDGTLALPLDPYSKDEALEYFQEKFPHIKLGKPELMAIEASAGMPLLLDLIAFYQDEELGPAEDLQVITTEELESSIIKVFLREENPYNKIFRELAYLKYRYEEDIFDFRKDAYPGVPAYGTLIAQVSKLPFVKFRESERSLALHDAFRDMFEKYYARWHGMALDLYLNISKWYEEAIISAQGMRKYLLQAEKLAYVLNLGGLDKRTLQGEKDYQLAKLLLKDYSNQNSDELNWLLINEISPEVVRNFPASDQYEVFSILGKMAKQVHRLAEAQQFWEGAVDAATNIGNPSLQVDALIEQHNSTWQSDVNKSFKLLEQAAALCKDNKKMQARVQYELGFTYRKIYNLVIATGYYHDALRIAKDSEQDLEIKTRIGTIYNDLGYSYLLIGDFDKAEVYMAKAKAVRIDTLNWLTTQLDVEKTGRKRIEQIRYLEEKIRDADWRLGLTFNTMGDLARYEENFDLASIEYSEAVEIFRRTSPHLWLATALHQRGDAHRQIAVMAARNNRRGATEKYDKLAFEDITSSIQLVGEYGLYEVADTSYRRLARLLHDRVWRMETPDKQLDLLDDVKTNLDIALKYAINNNDATEEMECRREIAFLADDRAAILMKKYGQIDREEKERMQQYIDQFRDGIENHEKKEFKIHNFSVFKNLFTLVEAAYAYSLGNDYQYALNKYIEAFISLAGSQGYGVGCYRKHRPHLWERIQSLDPKQRRQWCEAFRNAWMMASVKVMEGETEITKSLAEVHPKMYKWLTVELDE